MNGMRDASATARAMRAANGVTVLADAGIDHLRIWVLAKRAMHGLHNSLNH